MVLEQTITIVNNSGKIVSTGKHLAGIFKEARASYREKKQALQQQQNGGPSRGKSFSSPHGRYHEPIVEEFDDDDDDRSHRRHRQRSLGPSRNPLYLEGGSGSRSGRPPHRSSSTSRRGPPSSSRPLLLTEGNLRTHSEVSATSPSTVPQTYRDLALGEQQPPIPPRPIARSQTTMAGVPSASTPVSTPRMSMMTNRPRSDPSLRQHSGSVSPRDSSERHLAYGDMPPDLGFRDDLDDDPAENYETATETQKQAKAKTLVSRIEFLLTEAQCLHHSAASTIVHLQETPEAAAAVALTLAELSTLLGKLSPTFLGIIKGGSPAVWALLASPQFLIGSGIAVGVTVVLFGGWKIVKRMSDNKAGPAQPNRRLHGASTSGSHRRHRKSQHSLPSSSRPAGYLPAAGPGAAAGFGMRRSPTMMSDGFDEALVLQEELSSIETWRRGITPSFADGPNGLGDGNHSDVVDAELISPEALRTRQSSEARRSMSRAAPSEASETRSSGHRSSHSRSHGSQHHSHHGGSKHRHGGSGGSSTSRRASSRSGDHPNVPERSSSKSYSLEAAASSLKNLASPGSSTSSPALRPKEKYNGGGNNMLKQLFKKKEKEDNGKELLPVAVVA